MSTAAAELLTTGRYLALCVRCHVRFITSELAPRSAGLAYHSCGKLCNADPIKARYSSTKCGARCLSATSNICECQCEGQNHGGGH